MSKFYDDVKKQGTQIDDLQKKVTDHGTRIETLETQAMATPTYSDVPLTNVTVSIPDNIATTENISELVDEAIERNTDVMTNAITKLYTTVLPQPSTSQTAIPAISEEQIAKIAQQAADKATEKVINIRYDKLDAAADTIMHRIYNLVNGAVWAAIPTWVYALGGFIILAAVGLGIGCFHLYDDNENLRKTEWLYRYERLWWEGKHQEDLIRREKIFRIGTTLQQDSLKNLIRHIEASRNIDDTFLYFNPSEK